MADPDAALTSALDLMRRLPPQKVQDHLYKLIDICPEDIHADLYEMIDVPLFTETCKEHNRPFLCSDLNRDADSYRSPYSGKYQPDLDDGYQPPSELRTLEMKMNDAFAEYTRQYYSGGISSVYLWELDESEGEEGFNGVVLIKKTTTDEENSGKGAWDSINVIKCVSNTANGTASYELVTTVLLWLKQNKENFGTMDLSGSLTRQNLSDKKNAKFSKSDDHIKHCGELIENMENGMRNSLSEIYFSKTLTGINTCRSVEVLADDTAKHNLARDLNEKLMDKKNIVRNK